MVKQIRNGKNNELKCLKQQEQRRTTRFGNINFQKQGSTTRFANLNT